MQRSKISLFTSGHQKILVDISALSVAFRPFYWRIQVYVSIIYFRVWKHHQYQHILCIKCGPRGPWQIYICFKEYQADPSVAFFQNVSNGRDDQLKNKKDWTQKVH